MTCSPATLTAISRYWGKPAEHLEIAEEICYDGTPHTSERRWALEHGFIAREFRVDWQSARALVDRGVPFTLTTVYPAFAHLQAVIGYDAVRGTLVIRDPMQPAQGGAGRVECRAGTRSRGCCTGVVRRRRMRR